MKTIRFMHSNLWDSATVTASSAATGFPASNTVNRWHTRAWRTTGVASEWIKGDLGAAYGIKCCIIKYHNFTSSAIVKVEASTNDFATTSVTATMPVTSDISVYFFSTAQTYQYWRFTVSDATNTDGYVRMGRIFVGTYWSPSRDATAYSISYIDPSDMRYSTGGQLSANVKTKYKQISYQYNFITETDKVSFDSIFSTVGQSVPYFICDDADKASTTTRYVQNVSSFDSDALFYDDVNNKGLCQTLSMTVEECR